MTQEQIIKSLHTAWWVIATGNVPENNILNAFGLVYNTIEKENKNKKRKTAISERKWKEFLKWYVQEDKNND